MAHLQRQDMAQAQRPEIPTGPPISNDTREIIKCMTALGNSMIDIGHQISLPKATGERGQFDGTSPEQFRRWLAEVDNMHVENGGIDKQTIRAASRLLKGSALEYYHEVASSLQSWAHFKKQMNERYKHLDDADLSKQKLMTLTQRNNETIPQYAERLRTVAHQAYRDQLKESNVAAIITKAFINGILDRSLQEKVARRRPKDLNDAQTAAMDELKIITEVSMYTDHSRVDRPEPMDCSVVTSESKASASELSEVKELLKVLVERDSAQTQSQPSDSFRVQPQPFQVQPQHVTLYPYAAPPPSVRPLMSGPPFQQDVHTRNPQAYRWTPDNKPICAYCGIIGHVHRVCRRKAADRATHSQSIHGNRLNQNQGPPANRQRPPENK